MLSTILNKKIQDKSIYIKSLTSEHIGGVWRASKPTVVFERKILSPSRVTFGTDVSYMLGIATDFPETTWIPKVGTSLWNMVDVYISPSFKIKRENFAPFADGFSLCFNKPETNDFHVLWWTHRITLRSITQVLTESQLGAVSVNFITHSNCERTDYPTLPWRLIQQQQQQQYLKRRWRVTRVKDVALQNPRRLESQKSLKK